MSLVKLGDVAGTYADYAVAHESSLLHMPDEWSFTTAAAVPFVAMTAGR